jgi:hypothetical protein
MNLNERNHRKGLILGLFTLILATSACEKKNDDEQENITGLKIQLANLASNITYSWSDKDGIGTGAAPKVDTIFLTPNFTYDATMSVADGDKDLTSEVVAEKDEHEFQFEVTTVNLAVSNLSLDSKGKVFGQKGVFKSGLGSKGTLLVRLRHGDDKTLTGRETDIEVVFPVVVR